MSDVLNVTAIISPVAGKEAEVQNYIEAIVKGAQEKEPNTLSYVLTKAVEGNTFIVIESYKTPKDFEFHTQQSYFTDFVKALTDGGLVTEPPKIIASRKISGFESR